MTKTTFDSLNGNVTSVNAEVTKLGLSDLKLKEVVAFFEITDRGEPGSSVGDFLDFESNLLDPITGDIIATKSGSSLGIRQQPDGDLIALGQQLIQFEDGSNLYVQGTYNQSALYRLEPQTLRIIGGDGTFENARGFEQFTPTIEREQYDTSLLIGNVKPVNWDPLIGDVTPVNAEVTKLGLSDLELKEVVTFFEITDRGEPGSSVGDFLDFESNLLDPITGGIIATKSGSSLGIRQQPDGDLIALGQQLIQFEDGSNLYVQGTYNQSALYRLEPQTLRIIGGDGTFENARGFEQFTPTIEREQYDTSLLILA